MKMKSVPSALDVESKSVASISLSSETSICNLL
jgi:hypothetical protein